VENGTFSLSLLVPFMSLRASYILYSSLVNRLMAKYKVKGIPSLVILDDLGNVITLDGRNKIPQDKAGIGFPWYVIIFVYSSSLVVGLRRMSEGVIPHASS
jgi:hypothetical protein